MREVAWIEAVDHANRARAVTPEQALTEPDRWRAIQYDNPVRTAAVYRFLAAAHLAALRHGGIGPYLRAWDDVFWLDHEHSPFYQHPALAQTLETVTAPGSVLALDATRATGQNPLLWDHTTAADTVTLDPAEATVQIVTAASALPAGPGPFPVIDGQKGTCHHRPLGPVALTTMLIPYAEHLGLVLDGIGHEFGAPRNDDDAPVWERRDDLPMTKTTVYPAGPMEWLTWPAVYLLLGHTATGRIDRAVTVPGWYPDRELGVDRVDIDPFCTHTGGKRPKIADSSSIWKYEQLDLPPWMDYLTRHGPLAVHYIAQRLSQAKVTGVDQQRRYIADRAAGAGSPPARSAKRNHSEKAGRQLTVAPDEKKEGDPCQQPLF